MKKSPWGPSISRAAAEPLLAPYLPKIRSSVQTAWQDYQALEATQRARHSTRTRASLVHDFMRNRARAAFESRAGSPTRCLMVRGSLFLVAIGNEFLIRFKKLDETLHSSNIETQQVLDFRAQKDLPGIPSSATHLEAGYVLNRLQTDIASIHVTCPGAGSRIQWSIELEAEGETAEVFTLPVQVAGEPEAPEGAALKVKTQAAPISTKKTNEPGD